MYYGDNKFAYVDYSMDITSFYKYLNTVDFKYVNKGRLKVIKEQASFIRIIMFNNAYHQEPLLRKYSKIMNTLKGAPKKFDIQ